MDDIFTKIDFPELVGTLHDHNDSKVIRSYGMACARLAYKTSQDNQQAEITSLRAELEKAKKDGERYQWLRKRAFLNRFGWVFENIKYYKEPTTIDEAIDNAMKGNG